jgi:hypothetical protein
MGIVGVDPRQLVPTVGMTGSGSTDLLAPSPTITDLPALTRIDGSSPATTVDSVSATTINIDIASSAIDTNIDTASPTIVDTIASIDVNIVSPTIIESAPVFAIDPLVTTVIDPISSLMGSASART